MKRDDLSGRIALVTGASRGVGRAIALALAEQGADVAVNYRTHEVEAQQTCELVKRHNRNCVAVRADVSIGEDVNRLAETVESELGTVSILVNNAGITRPQSLNAITEQDWDEIVAVNLKSVFLVTQAVLPPKQVF